MSDITFDNSITIKDQAALDLHKIMLEAMRSRESDILHFVGFLLPAIVGFFTIGWLKGGESAILPGILSAVAAVTILILFFGAWYALALSYNYRYIQLVTWSLQKHLELDQFEPEWKPKQFQCGNLGIFNFAPEILRAQLLLFIALIIAAAILFGFASINLQGSLHWWSSDLVWAWVWVEMICILFIICWLGFSFYPKKYNKYCCQVLKKSNNRIKANAGQYGGSMRQGRRAARLMRSVSVNKDIIL